jgi:uroporphyrinogen III methyltransferase / synthase
MAANPLSGKRIVITRAPGQSRELVSALESKGATVLVFPLVAFAPPDDWGRLDEQLQRLSGFDAILFLSRNAVRYVFERCRELAIEFEAVPSNRPFVATIGPATEQALKEEGISVDYVAKGHTSESLARELGGRLAGKSVFLPRGNRGDEQLPDALRQAGVRVTEVVAYRTFAPRDVSPSILAGIRAGSVDTVVFFSPSAFHNLCELLGRTELVEISERVQFAAIGPTTARAICELGARVAVEAADPSAASMVDALAACFESRPAKTRRP